MARLILLNKPYDMLSQFTDPAGRATLARVIVEPGVYVCGRLDRDSEGLVLLTDCGPLQHRLSHPRFRTPKTYWVQVEGAPDPAALARLRRGVRLADGPARAEAVAVMEEPAGLWPRDPPIRVRKTIPTHWLRLTVTEGRNRMVRRMTAAVGLPTLRLIRWSVGDWTLEGLAPGCARALMVPDPPQAPAPGGPQRPRPGTSPARQSPQGKGQGQGRPGIRGPASGRRASSRSRPKEG